MIRFLLRRLAWFGFTLWCVSLATFTLMHAAPGDFYDAQIASAAATIGDTQLLLAAKEDWEARFGLERPLPEQYLIWLRGLLTGDLGRPYTNPAFEISGIISQYFPVSATLAFLAVAVALLAGMPLGIVAALRRNTLWDYAATLAAMLGSMIPGYVIATLLVLVCAVWLRLLPTSGWGQPREMVLPVLALSAGSIATIARYMRNSLIEQLQQPYVRTVRALGGPWWAEITGAVRNSLIPLVTVLGPTLASLMVGTVLIESVFRVPGLGRWIVNAASSRDYPMLMASAMFYAFLIMLMNLLVDLIYAWLDPRIRVSMLR